MKFYTTLLFVAAGFLAEAQTKTTQALDEKYDGLSLFFYRNTLRMLNQNDDPAFDELIKNIEKMRFMMINKAESKFTDADYKKLLEGYKGESYEEMMSGRADGRAFTVYLRESNGNVKGTVILAKDDESVMVLDILGKIAINKVPEFFNAIDNSTDIGGKIKDFMSDDDKKEDEKENKTGNN
ncbi:MAG TPA: hypothetical protein DHV26_06100 [Cytophagales bacterium]|nr:hypothetical protein [Cytophagales bacterium]HRG08437.1 DUF4252 domain-containing protein [Cyclobacteriaceae bacterium]